MSNIFQLQNKSYLDAGSWTPVAKPSGDLVETCYIPGSCGITRTEVYVTPQGRVFLNSNNKWSETKLWVLCFQRVNTQIQLCDAVWVLDGVPVVHTIARSLVESIVSFLVGPVYNGGLDPLPWHKFARDAKQYGWTVEDWQHLLGGEEVENTVENTVEADSDWVPGSDSSESESESESEL